MKDQGKFISRDGLSDWLTELSARFDVWAPRREGEAATGAVVYRPFDAAKGVELDKKPTESAKHAIFPRSEALINYRRNQSSSDPGKPALCLETPEAPPPRLVFGLPSCDARGFLILDPVYNGSGTQGQAKDIYYLRRRANTILIAKACSRVLSTCFCNWTGGSPASVEGVDVLATEVTNGCLLVPVSEDGASALDSSLLKPADDAMISEAEQNHSAAEKALSPAMDISGAMEGFVKRFEDMDFWRSESAHCLSCGICTYLCPTCYCFNITDESAGLNGVRLRNWDKCMSPLFTREASGHNPRTTKAMRLKNRVGHKFSYYPRLNKAIACVGCGRCIRSCPSGVDIRRIVAATAGLPRNEGR
jgi:ferredoxin